MRNLPRRPRLELALDGALTHRLTLLSADAGFGKSTLLADWSVGINAVVHAVTSADQDLDTCWRHLVDALLRHLPDLPGLGPTAAGVAPGPASAHRDRVRPDAMAELLGHALERHLTRDLVIALDDVHLLGDGPSARLLTALVRHAPALLHLALAGREPPPVATARLRAQGQVLELDGAQLAFTTDEVAALLTTVVGTDATGLAARVRDATGGWPIAVRLAVEALRDVDPRRRAEQVADWAASDAQLTDLVRASYARESPGARRLLATVARFERFPQRVCEALSLDDAPGLLAGLTRRGLFVEPVAAADDSGGQWCRLHPLARRFVTEQAALPAEDLAALQEAAVRWCVDNGLAHLALRSLTAVGDHAHVARLLADTGDRLVVEGHADAVVDAVTRLPPAMRDSSIDQLAAHALLLRGEWDDAMQRYQAAAGDQDRLPAGLAWRIGLIHYLRGEHDRALAAYERADIAGPPTRATAMTLAWAASAHWILGQLEQCGKLATRALRAATEVDDPAALAAAHTVLSMLAAQEGDRRANAAHYRKALEYAQQAGDVLQLVRIHANRSSHHLEEGTYAQAMTELDTAIRLADLSGYGAFGALALTNRAEIRLRLGQLEDAHRDLESAVGIFDDLGSRAAGYPLRLLGDLHLVRGDSGAARRAYEQAIAHATASGDRQGAAPALAGLARVLAEQDPHQATALADRAVSYGEGLGYATALLASARVAAVRGDAAQARWHARQAGRVAASRRDRAAVAEALEVEATVTEDQAQARALAGKAAAQWAEIGDPIGIARAQLAYAERLDEAAAHAMARTVRIQMEAIGARTLAARAGALAAAYRGEPGGPVRVETLGAFRVVRDGVVLPPSAWRSRKARDLLKILVARRGRPVSREFLMQALWPAASPAQLTNRFHVAVSTLRSVLDGGRRFDSDTFVATEDSTLRVRLDKLEVDVERFLTDATTGAALWRAGRADEALPRMARAEAGYSGDFLEENPYEDWAVPVREQARAAYIEVATRLAEHAEAVGDLDAATRYMLRTLEHDPYDERVHLRLVSTLVATGRHGDARRHYRQYCARMDELEIEPAPFPAA